MLQYEQCEEELKKSWGEIEDDIGLEVVADEEVEHEKEDREVENILEKGKETKSKLATGTVHDILCQTGQTVYRTVHV